MKISDSFEKFLLDGSSYWAKSTGAYYRKNAGYFLSFVLEQYGDCEIRELPEGSYRDFILSLRGKHRFVALSDRDAVKGNGSIKNNTVRSYARASKVYLRWLHEKGYLSSDFSKGVKLPKSDDEQVIPLTRPEVQRIDQEILRNDFEPDRNYIVFHLMLDCGLRVSEVQRLRYEDIDFHSRFIRIRNSKGNKSRVVQLPEFLAFRIHTRYSDARWQLSGVSYSSVMNFFRQLRDRTGIQRLHPHLLRHTFATSYIMGGGDLETLRILLGHSSYEVTKTYLHLASQFGILNYDIYRLDIVQAQRGYAAEQP